VRQRLNKCIDKNKIFEAFQKALSPIKPPPTLSSSETTTALTDPDCYYISPDWRGATLEIRSKDTSAEQCQQMKAEFQKAFDSCNSETTPGLEVRVIVGISIGALVIVAGAVGLIWAVQKN
jgi:hypothetical protein